jgi:transposase InsO family protein
MHQLPFSSGRVLASARRLLSTASPTERLAEAGLVPSVDGVGDSYENALAETINGLYTAEVIHRRGPWRSMEAIEFATLEWVDWFNNRRLPSSIGNIPPAVAETTYWACQEDQAITACLKRISLWCFRGGSRVPHPLDPTRRQE